MQCCILLRGRVELLQSEIRDLRNLLSFGIPNAMPGPFEDDADAEAGGIADFQIYLGLDGAIFTKQPIT